jgi:hypothetical protein
MVRRILLAVLGLLAFCFAAAPASAVTCGGFVVPPDVANQAGWTCNTVTPQYDVTNSSPNTWLDPAVTPNPQTGFANIPVPSYGAGRITALSVCEYANCTGPQTGVTCTSFGRVVGEGGDSTCTETKFRTGVDFSHYSPDDPIRNFGAPGTSHLHCFFGNGSTNAFSTYKTLRQRAITSTAIGTDINGTGYWYPCVVVPNRDGDGVAYVVKPDFIVVYYAGDGSTPTLAANAEKSTLLVPGLRYVFGYNMDDGGKPTDADSGMGAWLKTVLDAANTANAAAGGSASRYSVKSTNGSHPNSVDYVCLGATVDSTVQASSTQASRFLVRPDGGDPYNGTCEAGIFNGSANSTTLTVTSVSTGKLQPSQAITSPFQPDYTQYVITAQLTSTEAGGVLGGAGTYSLSHAVTGTPTFTNQLATHLFYIGIAGAQCWDGKNLWTPGGYKNVVALVYDVKYSAYVCPKNYYHIPSLRLEIGFMQYGWADRQRWILTSDAGARTRNGSCSLVVCPSGFSFHTDWMHGWDMVKGAEWMRKCLGAEHNIPHQCAVSQINATEALGGYIQPTCSGAPSTGAGGRCPQVDTSPLPHLLNSDPGWGKIPSTWLHTITGTHGHAMNDNIPMQQQNIQASNDNITPLYGAAPIHFSLGGHR